MRHIWSIAAKELRGYFNSAIALIFLATFLAVVLYAFFFVDRFFARNIADVRPLFEWLPLLLIFLVSALTMRQWSEEQKSGTLEVLLTLPVPVHRLVLGKFLAGLLLVAVALALTLGLPLTVSQMGNLDWGPVFGGYVAALLLASTYLAIGLCISSVTENQIVALIATMAVGCLLYLPGTDVVTSLAGIHSSELLRMLGTGSRFESIARGVLDLRDLAYYASLVALFLTLNTVILKAKRWSSGERTRVVRTNARATVALVALNALALNIWLKPVDSARIDLTESGVYSLSEPTEEIIRSLNEPLTISGYFSDRVHEKLDPLVPQIRDILTEYKVVGGSNVRLAFIDPGTDEELEKELNERFNIQSLPVRSFTRRESSVINAYFHVLISYGDQYEVLSFENLTRVEMDGEGEPVVLLGNIEYEVTKAVRKVVYGFQSLETLFASVSDDIVLEAYLSDNLPQNLQNIATAMENAAHEMEAQSGGRLKYRVVRPTDDQRFQLSSKYGLEPLGMWNGSQVTYIYFHWLMRIGDSFKLVDVPLDESQATPAGLRLAISSGLRRTAPGFIRMVGMVVPTKGETQEASAHMPSHETPPEQTFNALQQMLGGTYEVRPVDLEKGEVPDEVEVLVIAGPDRILPKGQLAIDQFLMRGGAVVVLVANYRPNPQFRANPVTDVVTTGMDKLLEHYGVTVGDGMVMDTLNDEAILKLGLRFYQIRYPLFVQVAASTMRGAGIMASGMDGATLHFASPLSVTPPPANDGEPGVKATVLMSSSPDSWLHTERNVRPDLGNYPDIGFARPPASEGPFTLAVSLTGSFTSAFVKDEGNEGVERPDKLLTRSPPDARLVVVGSSAFVSDEILAMASDVSMRAPQNNLRFLHNLVDWAVADTDLLSIRASRTAANLDVAEDGQDMWEWGNYGLAFVGLLLVVIASRVMPKPTIDLAAARKLSGKPRKSGGSDKPGDAAEESADKAARKTKSKSSDDEEEV